MNGGSVALCHSGNDRYLFGLTRAARKGLSQSMKYPKMEDARAR